MAGAVIYLDVDDELTSAASRIRTAEGSRVAVVLPYGSRVATSRINFRLLGRDATRHEKRLAIVAGDAATRALAASAGLPVFASVQDYESAFEDLEADGGGAPGAVGLAASATVVAPPDPPDDDASRASSDTGATTIAQAALSPPAGAVSRPGPTPARPARRLPEDTGGSGADGLAPDRHEPRVPTSPGPRSGKPVVVARAERVRRPSIGRERPGPPRTPILLGLAVIALVVVVGGVAAWLLLPSASIAVTPRQQTVGPIPFQVTASTSATEPDPEARVVPAEVVDLHVEVSDTFEATGTRVEESKATAEVRFDNLDPTASNSIAKGAVISTNGGIRFRTDRAIRIPAAKLVGLTIQPSSVRVKVTAVDAGPEGNVEPNTIRVVPRGEEPIFLDVTNEAAASGGSRTEFPRVKQEDLDAAVAALTTALDEAFRERLDDDDLTTDGATVFPDTATLGVAVFDRDVADLVGLEQESFDLGASADGTVTAVDAEPVQAIAADRLAGSVDAGYQLVDGSEQIRVDPGVVSGGIVSFPVVVTAIQVRILDPAEIEAAVKGRPLEEARQILDGFGESTLEVWPEWVATVPTMDGRVDVEIDGPTVEEASP